jgi:cellulose synthase/poly-beta-1,6-N-acetylglucosamine synthase-like glycosyltransferase
MTYSVFLAAVGVVLYSWIAYPLVLWLLRLCSSRPTSPGTRGNDPYVSIIIPVHNEEQRIAEKLENCLELLYPHDRLEILVASDASTDRTEKFVHAIRARDSRIRWLASNRRVGKSGIQNLAVTLARGDVLFFTDANTTMSAGVLRTMVDALADPTVGLVTAEVSFGRHQDAISRGQGFYWRYELFLRTLESDLGILAAASGQALAVRGELFRPIPDCYGDDCIMPLDVRLQGYRVLQNREAIVFDGMPHSIAGEFHTRIRMTARNWSGTLSRPALLNPLRFPATAIGLVSHKLLRWLTPFFLAVVLASNALLVMERQAVVAWWLQMSFYVSALAGWQLARKHRPAGVFGYPFSFCLANVGFLFGMVKALRNQRIVGY